MTPQMPVGQTPARRVHPDDVEAVKSRARIVEVVEAYVQLGKPSGGNIKGLCPFHDEKTPSFNLTPTRGLFHCFGCGESGDVIDFIAKVENLTFTQAVEHLAGLTGLQIRYQAPDESPQNRTTRRTPAKTNEVGAPRGPKPKRITGPQTQATFSDHSNCPEATAYPYVDEHGEVLGEAVRHECLDPAQSKCFSQRRTEPGGAVVRKGLDRAVPYRLPEVIAAVANGQTIYLCEGEKDADRIAELGYPATTNIGGAGNFKPELVEFFRGGHVHVVLDRDRAGYERFGKLERALTPVVETITFLVAAADVTAPHADLSDHLDAGHDLADLVRVTSHDVRAQLALYQARDCLEQALIAAAESAAQHARSINTEFTDKQREQARRYAERWAYETAKLAETALGAHRAALAVNAAPVTIAEIRDKTEQVLSTAREAWHAHDVTPPTAVQKLLATTVPTHNADGGTEGSDDVPDNVRSHPTAARQAPPPHRLPMSRGQWAYSLGEADGNEPGVYTFLSEQWHFVAPLPHVHATIIRRDGSGRRVGTDYVLSVDAASPTTVVDLRALRDGQWANDLGMMLSDDDKIVRATSTAIKQLALEVPAHEAVLRVKAGEAAQLPRSETIPAGYLQTAPVPTEEALESWRRIVELLGSSPRIALTLGASAVSPWIGALGRQSHVINIYGDVMQGKTITAQVVAGLWGDSISKGGTLQAWNATGLAPGRLLGDLGCLPAVYDESGMTGFEPRKWGELIFAITQGAQRSGARRNQQTGISKGLPWEGVFITTGNGRITHGLGAGRFAGITRRVLELPTPLTSSEAQADALTGLVERAYGHLARPLLDGFSTDDVQSLIDAAQGELPGEGIDRQARAIAKHLWAHIAGAAMIDQVLGTGDALRRSALAAARELMDEWAPPEHDADRVLDIVRDAIAAEPSRWPTARDYAAIFRPFNAEESNKAPAHGVSPEIHGIRSDDDLEDWVAVLPRFIHPETKAADIDESVAWRELHHRGVLNVPAGQKKSNIWQGIKKLNGKVIRCYLLHLPEDTIDDTDPELPPTEPPVTAETGPGNRSVTGAVTGAKGPLTCEVTGVTGVTAENVRAPAREAELPPPAEYLLDEPQPCEGCTQPCVTVWHGHVLHPTCTLPEPAAPEPPPAPEPAAPKPPATPAKNDSGRRWSGPALVADRDGLHLPDGTVQALPADLSHLGQLGDLIPRYRIGWGGTKTTLPEHGQLVIMRDLADDLGIPAELPDYDTDDDAATGQLPVMTRAREDGWNKPINSFTGEQDWRIRPWMRMWRAGAGGFGVRVHIPHLQTTDVDGLYTEHDTPAAIARRAVQFAEWVGIPYRMSPSITGIDLLKHLRTASGRAVVVQAEIDACEPARAPNRSFDLLLRREPAAGEDSAGWVHAWDVNSAYLAACSGLRVGTDTAPTHLTDGVQPDLTKPGYWRIELPDFSDLDPRCPHPIDGNDDILARREGKPDPGWRWVTTPKLRLLTDLGIDVQIHEAYLWSESVRYFDGWNKRLRDALYAAAEARATGDPDAAQIRTTIKNCYAHGIGRLDARTLHDGSRSLNALWRPDWRHAVMDETYRRIWRTVHQVGTGTGRWPLAIVRDSLWYAADTPEADAAVPEGLSLHPTQLGKYKHEGVATLDEAMPFLRGERAVRDAAEVFKT